MHPDRADRANVAAPASLVALVGQPNAGKTSLFNALTGLRSRTANYPGVTVSYCVGQARLPDDSTARILDAPGMASLAGRSPDETVAIEALYGGSAHGAPDLVVAVVDATQLARHLYLASQVRDAGFPLLLAVTMTDLLPRRGVRLDLAALAERFGAPAVAVNGRTGEGTDSLLAAAAALLRKTPSSGARPVRPPPSTPEAVLARYRAAESIEREAVRLAGGLGEGGSAPATVLRQADPLTERIDAVLLHPLAGGLLFAAIMTAIFTSVFWLAAPAMDAIDTAFAAAGEALAAALPESWWTRLAAEGLIQGVGAAAVFLPQIFILFLGLGILDDTGYLARAALIVDRPLSAAGLSGRAFVPLLSGFACAIPGMMAARTIPSRRERLLTLFAMPLMTCSARLPVYGVLIALVTPRESPWIAGMALAGLYLASMVVGLAAAGLYGRFLQTQERSVLFLELPTYRLPRATVVVREAIRKTGSYVRRAAWAIMLVALALWTITHLPPASAGADEADAIASSWGGAAGRLLEPAMRPLGLDWRAGVAMLSGFLAREVFPTAMAILFRAEGDPGEMETQLAFMTNATFPDGSPLFTGASCAGLVVFFLFALQCGATVVVSRQESGSLRFALAQLAIFTGFAYVASVATVQGLRALGVP